MAFRQNEYQIGRGEVAESRIEAPFFAVFMIVCAVALLVFHHYVQVQSLTIALAVSMILFGATILRVDLGVYVLVVAMMLSPEVDTGPVGVGYRRLNLRYDDILIIVVFTGVLVKQAWEGSPWLWRPSPINSSVYLFYGICLLSSMMAYWRSLGMWDRQTAFFVLLKMAEFYMVLFLVGSAIRSKAQIRNQVIVFFVVAMIVAGYGIYSRMIGGQRVGAPFEAGRTEPNTMGGYLTLVMCMAAAFFTQAPTRGKRILCLLVLFSAFVPFLFTLSRASYLAFIVGILALSVATRSKLIFISVIAVLALSPYLMPADVKDRVNYTFQRGGGVPVTIAGQETGLQVDKSTNERLYVWEKVRYNFYVWPWLGGGVAWDNVLDSQYARVIVETGIIGMLSFLYMQYRLLRTTRETFRWAKDWFGRGLALGTFVSTLALMVHSLGTISFLIVRIMEPYWFLVALTIVTRAEIIDAYVKEQQDQKIPASPAPPTRHTTVVPTTAGVMGRDFIPTASFQLEYQVDMACKSCHIRVEGDSL